MNIMARIQKYSKQNNRLGEALLNGMPVELREDFSGDNRPNLDNLYDLVQAARHKSLIPFVGAGMSVPLGLPSWYDFLVEMASSLSERLGLS